MQGIVVGYKLSLLFAPKSSPVASCICPLPSPPLSLSSGTSFTFDLTDTFSNISSYIVFSSVIIFPGSSHTPGLSCPKSIQPHNVEK